MKFKITINRKPWNSTAKTLYRWLETTLEPSDCNTIQSVGERLQVVQRLHMRQHKQAKEVSIYTWDGRLGLNKPNSVDGMALVISLNEKEAKNEH